MVSLTACALACVLSGADSVVMLEFTAEGCGACRSVEPTVQRLVSEGYPIQRVPIDRESAAAAKFGVTAVPCFILLAGDREVDRVVGAASYARLAQMFSRVQFAVKPTNSSPPQELTAVRGQSPGSDVGFGLPRPLAAFAKGLNGAASLSAPLPSGSSSSITGGQAERNAEQRLTSQASQALPGATPQVHPQAVQWASLATVRLRVEDGSGHSVGTGTIIDIHGEEALVVTCGHIFRDSQGKGRITVDLFADGQPRTVPGTLISHDLERDIALVAIVPGCPVRPVQVAPTAYQLLRGQTVFSLGCDKGADPTPRVSSITAVDRYVGAPNLEVAGMPVDGRSGGGLFSSDGLLIGLCNAADPQDQEGIFASLPVVHWELDKIGQRRIYDTRSQALAATPPTPAGAVNGAGSLIPGATFSAGPSGLPLTTTPANAVAMAPVGPDTEVICIVRSRSNPQGSERLLVLDRPSRELLDRLTTESQGRAAELARAVPVVSPAMSQGLPGINPINQDSIIRAQSDR